MYAWKSSFRCVDLCLRLVVPLTKYWLCQCLYKFGKFGMNIWGGGPMLGWISLNVRRRYFM